MYQVYSKALKEKYGEKVYKLPVNLPVTCPNRDGYLATGGCIYCGAKGAGFESLPSELSVSQQIRQNAAYIGKKYHAKKFIAYFQNFSNTYLPIERLRSFLEEAAKEDVVGIDLSTRPDCISDGYLEMLKEISQRHSVSIGIELGLQSVNYHTLKKINRGHTLAEFLDAVRRIQRFDFEICTHVILDLPWDGDDDVIETAKILSAMEINSVKLHSLYVVKDTPLARAYQEGTLPLFGVEDYVRRCVLFLRYLSPEIVIVRLIGRAPEEDTLTANFGMSWWKVKDRIDREMEPYQQGDLCDYLNGRALGRFQEERKDGE